MRCCICTAVFHISIWGAADEFSNSGDESIIDLSASQ
jgi:hypothetical protein